MGGQYKTMSGDGKMTAAVGLVSNDDKSGFRTLFTQEIVVWSKIVSDPNPPNKKVANPVLLP